MYISLYHYLYMYTFLLGLWNNVILAEMNKMGTFTKKIMFGAIQT